MRTAEHTSVSSAAGKSVLWVGVLLLSLIAWAIWKNGPADWLAPVVGLLIVVTLIVSGLPLTILRRVTAKRLYRLADLFEEGSVSTVDGALRGKFQGRFARVSIESARIKISMAGDFSLLFQARRRWSVSALLSLLTAGPLLLLLILYVKSKWTGKRDPLGSVDWWGLALMLLPLGGNRVFGNTRFYKTSNIDVSFPGSKSLQFSAGSWQQFAPVIQHVEIQQSILRLIDADRTELLHVALLPPNSERYGATGWLGHAEANFYYRRKWLERGHVQSVLADLSVLCQTLEAITKAGRAE